MASKRSRERLEVSGGRGRRRQGSARGTGWRRRADDHVDGRNRPVVLVLEGRGRVQVHQGQDLDGLAQVVEDQQVVRQHQPGLGHGDGRIERRQPLDVAHHVVAQKPHQPAPEPGQPRGRHRDEPGQEAAQVLKGVDRGVQGLLAAAVGG